MTITNHILAGSAIGLAITNRPVLAIILAIASHFVMDTLPHFGYPGQKGYAEVLRHRLSYWVGFVTVLTSVAIALLLAWNGEWFALLLGLLAASPDALGIYNYLRYEKHGRQAKGLLKAVHIRFHRAIQQYERPWGLYVELVVAVVLTLVLLALLRK